MKRIMTMQDLSCLGRCSLTEAIPVLSAMELETVVLPTALLSSHTAFPDVFAESLLQPAEEVIHCWQENHITFDAIYIGYLGSNSAIRLAEQVIDTFGIGIPVLIDPAFGDQGHLYRGINEDYPARLRSILGKAAIICPNLTEACFLTETPYFETYNEQQYRQLLEKLCTICSTAVLTGIDTGNNNISTVLQTNEGGFQLCSVQKEPASFHGTGDLWAAAFFGAFLHDLPVADAMNLANRFVKEAIHISLQDHCDPLFGTEFEKALPLLIQLLHERKH